MINIKDVMMTYADVHKKMMRYVFLQTELLLNDEILELSEYDIQSLIFTFFRSRLAKFNLVEATRETENRTDIVVHQSKGKKVYIELKTYFKRGENFQQVHFNDDFKKLLEKVNKEKSICYFIIAGHRSKFNESQVQDYDFLIGKYLRIKEHTTYPLNIDDKIVNIKIRPSAAESVGECRLWSWEIVG